MKSHLKTTLLGSIVAVVALYGTATTAVAQQTKTSTGSGAWENPASWNPPGVPGPNDTVIIAGGHDITTTGPKNIKWLTVQWNAKLSGNLDVEIKATDCIVNQGEIRGGNANQDDQPGGKVKLEAGKKIRNGGNATMQGGDGGKNGDGGSIDLDAGTDIDNDAGGTIRGGKGGTKTKTGPKSQGGHVEATAGGKVTNGGTIRAGDGGSSNVLKGGTGGHVSLDGQGQNLNTGTIRPGTGGNGGSKGGDGLSSQSGGDWATSSGTVHGSFINIQSGDDRQLALNGLAPGAIQSSEGKITIYSDGALDLTGNSAAGGLKIIAQTEVIIRCDTILLDPGVSLVDLIAPPPVVKPRTQLIQLLPPQIGNPYDLQIVSPADPGHSYFCVTSLTLQDQPLFITDVGMIPLTPDPLFYGSLFNAPPFVDSVGILDPLGQGASALVLPPVPGLAGLELHTQALVTSPSGFENLSAVRTVTVTR